MTLTGKKIGNFSKEINCKSVKTYEFIGILNAVDVEIRKGVARQK